MGDHPALSNIGPARRHFLGAVLPAGLAASALSVAAVGAEPAGAIDVTLVGLWNVDVTFPNPPPGLEPTEAALMTFDASGTAVLLSSTNRTTAIGLWRPTGVSTFDFLVLQYLVDSDTGELIGVINTRQSGQLNPPRNRWTSSGTGTVTDVDLNPIFPSIQSVAEATRITFS
jgi:hypothetical protein